MTRRRVWRRLEPRSTGFLSAVSNWCSATATCVVSARHSPGCGFTESVVDYGLPDPLERPDQCRGSLEDLDSLKRGAAGSDGVIHLAFNHDFSKFVANCEDDRRVIKALGSALEGSDRPLILTSATPIANTVPGQPAKEDNAIVGSGKHPRAASEEAGAPVAADGVNVSVVRLPQVHDPVAQGLITPAIGMSRQKGVCT